jgi:hypothetical protein
LYKINTDNVIHKKKKQKRKTIFVLAEIGRGKRNSSHSNCNKLEIVSVVTAARSLDRLPSVLLTTIITDKQQLYKLYKIILCDDGGAAVTVTTTRKF